MTMLSRLVNEGDRLLKGAKRKLEWHGRTPVPQEVWERLRDLDIAIMNLSEDVWMESGRCMSFNAPGPGQPPLNPKSALWGSKLHRIELELGTIRMALRPANPKPFEATADAEDDETGCESHV